MLDSASVHKTLDLMRQEDRGLRVSGSGAHHYRLNPPLSEEEVRRFESDHQLSLPPDYREFLREVGDGGAGPHYGLMTLAEAARGRILAAPFPFTQEFDRSAPEVAALWDDPDFYPGLLVLSHLGCATYDFLVVQGATYGQIWTGRDLYSPSGKTFSEWYKHWLISLEEALPVLENERRAKAVQVGMSKQQVIDIIRLPYKEYNSAWRFLRFEKLATEFVIAEDDHVSRIIRQAIY